MGSEFNGGQGFQYEFHTSVGGYKFTHALSPPSSLLPLTPDSIWPVYILPEEVGMRCHIIGINLIALRSGVQGGSIGRLDIYNAADPTTPLISWERDKMRRTGKTGNLVFIEIGRRCQGGPGLVWMFTGFNDAQALRETLHK